MNYEMRPITDDEVPEFLQTDSAGFFDTISEEAIERERPLLDLSTTLAAFHEGRIVASSGAYSFEITVPGPSRIPASGLAWVAVHATHRRHGLLRTMVTHHLETARARGAPVSILYASESTIYGRFGYGIATHAAQYRIDRAHAALARHVDTSADLTNLTAEEAANLLPKLYTKVAESTVGALNRDEHWWRRFFGFGETSHGETGARHYVVAHGPTGELEGYATYRVKRDWHDGLADSTLSVGDCFGLTPRATASLWRFLTTQDLVGTMTLLSRPLEEPLRELLADSRRLRTTHYIDGLWLRILDVPVALEARRYQLPTTLVLEVKDNVLAGVAGRYRLEASPDGARCQPTSAEPDLRLDIADLSAMYLGGTRSSLLAQAGKVIEEHTGALRLADALFAAEMTPFCTVQF
jgi:predicted acetyltransferase